MLPARQPQVQGAVPVHGEAGPAGQIRWVAGAGGRGVTDPAQEGLMSREEASDAGVWCQERQIQRFSRPPLL